MSVVWMHVDRRNDRSQRAIERIGGEREGVLRKHMLMPDGAFRDSVYYGITDEQWPSVKTRLGSFLNSREKTTLEA